MTVRELSNLHLLNREIEQHERRIAELEAKAAGSSPTITGMPHSPGVTDKVGKYAIEIADLRTRLEAAIERRTVERAGLIGYIEAIPDSLTRQIFWLRFIDCLSWGAVARRMGGGNTAEGVRKRIRRHVK
jgi:hypothetical protein